MYVKKFPLIFTEILYFYMILKLKKDIQIG